MSKIHPNTLFHFTKKFDTLKSILCTGLKFSYCFEETVDEFGFAIPMICFCDIPLFRTLDHRKIYGSYMIGLDKDYLLLKYKSCINPVEYKSSFFTQYFSKDQYEKYIETISDIFPNGINKYILDNNLGELIHEKGIEEIFKMDEKIGYQKDLLSLVSMQIKYDLVFSKKFDNKLSKRRIINYNEREWRIISNQYYDDYHPLWQLKISDSEFVNSKEELNKILSEHKIDFLTIEPNELNKAIKFIVLKSDNQIVSAIHLLRTSKRLFGFTDVTKEQRDLLISKITTFETIENNY